MPWPGTWILDGRAASVVRKAIPERGGERGGGRGRGGEINCKDITRHTLYHHRNEQHQHTTVHTVGSTDNTDHTRTSFDRNTSICLRPCSALAPSAPGISSCSSKAGTMLSTATRPTMRCRRLKARAAASRTSSSSSHNASLTAGRRTSKYLPCSGGV